MHNYLSKDVAESDFNLSLLSLSNGEISELLETISSSSDKYIDNIKKTSKNPGYIAVYPYDLIWNIDILSNISEQLALSLIFQNSLVERLEKQIIKKCIIPGSTSSLYNDYNALSSCLRPFIMKFSSDIRLADKIFSFSNYQYARNIVAENFLCSEKLILDLVKKEEALLFSSSFATRLIDLYGSDESKIFLKSKNDSVRLDAYKKCGVRKHISEMLVDTSANIRLAAASSLKYGDEKFLLLINDKSKNVFKEVVFKISAENLPLLIVNKHLKNAYFKKIFQQRIESARS